MNKNKKFQSNVNDEYIDLVSIISTIYKQKILVIFLTIIFGISGFIYSKNLSDQYYSIIKIKSISDITSPIFEYEKYYRNLLVNKNLLEDDSKKPYQFANEIKREVLSKANFLNFVEGTETARSLINFLKKNNINNNDYFIDDYIVHKAKSKNNDDELVLEFKLFYPKEVQGDKILNEYGFFISKKVFSAFVHKVETSTKQTLNIKQLAFNIAKKINLTDPQFLSDAVFNQSDHEYLKGTKVLNEEIKKLNQELDFMMQAKELLSKDESSDIIKYSTPSFYIEWQPIIEKAYFQTLPIDRYRYVFIGSVIGFVLSLLLILVLKIKKNISNKKYL